MAGTRQTFIGLAASLLFAGTTITLVATTYLLWIQSSWDAPATFRPREAFYRGTIGTEIMPLPVFVALPRLTPEYFQPDGTNRSFAAQFGMNHQLGNSKYGLPTGLYLSNKRPKSGAPSPVKFVGIACVMCHSTEIHTPDNRTEFIVGTGNMNLNLFAWIDAFQAAVLDERLTIGDVCRVFEEETGEAPGFQERLMMKLWLCGTRERVAEAVAKYGDPFTGEDALHPEFVPTGPGRTQPFRTLVRRLMDRPGSDMAVYTKISAVFHEDRREWAQVDGSIRDLYARSSTAAFAAGATVQNMATPDIAANIRAASDYTRDLGTKSFFSVFPEHKPDDPDEQLALGRKVYEAHCHSCHGTPTSGGWKRGDRQGDVVDYREIRTDPERVAFRRFEELPDLIHQSFPEDHPFRFAREDIRPGPAGNTLGYINAPIEHAWARAPYLHNASVLTLAELIHLKPRRSTFFRGRNTYDPVNVGLESPDKPTREVCFEFDVTRRGNSNAGHDYPWALDDPDRDEEALKALLEYLKRF